MFEYFVPIESSAELDGDFTINGIAINETTTSNGHKFIGEELSKAASTLVGVPLLKDHNNSVDSIVGKVNSAYWNETLRNIPFKAVVKDTKMKQLIQDKLLSSVSVGAHVRPEDIEETETGEVIPHNIQFKELSLVAVPADGGATFSVAFNNAYKLHSTKETKTKVDNPKSNERGDNKMTEEKISTDKPISVEKSEVEISEEEKALDLKIEKLRIEAKKKQLKLMEADADEVEPKVEPEVKAPEPTPVEEEEEESEEVEEKGDYMFTEGHRSVGIQRKSYVYN